MRFFVAMFLVVVLGVLGACAPGSAGPEQTEEEDAVALVNGEQITESEFSGRLDRMMTTYEQQGVPVEDEEMVGQLEQALLEEMINQTLLLQRAENLGITVSDADVDAEYEQIVEQAQGEEALQQQMEQQGITQSELEQMIEQQLVLGQLIEHLTEQEGTDISEADIEERYQEYASSSEQGEDFPPLEEVEDQLEQELEQEQQNQVVQDLLDELHDEAEIETYL